MTLHDLCIRNGMTLAQFARINGMSRQRLYYPPGALAISDIFPFVKGVSRFSFVSGGEGEIIFHPLIFEWCGFLHAKPERGGVGCFQAPQEIRTRQNF